MASFLALTRRILYVIQAGIALLAAISVSAWAADEPPNAGKKPVVRTRAEVEALIKTVGRSPPDWFADTPLNPPKTLDLTWGDAPKGKWDNQKYINQYIWDVINPNPRRWREGVKLIHTVAGQNRNKKEILFRATNTLGHLYGDCLEDYARAAYWWSISNDNDLDLAFCYWKLGCKEMAVEILERYDADHTRFASIIKMWADIGELDKALAMVEPKAEAGAPAIAYLTAGDACRLAGKYDKALAYYEKAVASKADNNDAKRHIERAKNSMDAIKLFDKFDPKRVPDGSYSAESRGYEGPIQVSVDVKKGRIEAVRITQHREKQFYAAMTETPRQIIEKQSIKGVDATSGATITSEAIINATAKALATKTK